MIRTALLLLALLAPLVHAADKRPSGAGLLLKDPEHDRGDARALSAALLEAIASNPSRPSLPLLLTALQKQASLIPGSKARANSRCNNPFI